METGLHPFFMAADGGRSGQRFCIHHAPVTQPVRGAVLYVHPFAEEMNKSRRMAALASRTLAESGFAVLQIDLLGCGDSSGDFGDATWADWVADVEQGARWLREQHPAAPLTLWGLRAGCLLAAEAAARIGSDVGQLHWQPPASGKALLQQFLRLQMAASLVDGKPSTAAADPRQELAAGRSPQIAGYVLNPALTSGLERTQWPPAVGAGRSVWLETSSRDNAPLLPATQTALTRWQQAGHDVVARVVPGPAFWQTQEIEDAPRLVEATLHAMQELQDEALPA